MCFCSYIGVFVYCLKGLVLGCVGYMQCMLGYDVYIIMKEDNSYIYVKVNKRYC